VWCSPAAGPAAAAFGPRQALGGAGVLLFVTTAATVLVPSIRSFTVGAAVGMGTT
jgi:hypothetical protein